VNPSLGVCFYCLESNNELVLLGSNRGKEAPHHGVYHMEPCEKCAGYMKQGVILIGVTSHEEIARVEAARREYKSQDTWSQRRKGIFIPNPERSGHFLVMSEDWVKRAINPPELRDNVLKCRWTFAEKELCEMLNRADKELHARRLVDGPLQRDGHAECSAGPRGLPPG